MVLGGGGGTENFLNCCNSRNICHSEERFSVLESPSYALFFMLSKSSRRLSKAECKVS